MLTQHPQAAFHIYVHLQAANSYTQASSSTPHERNNFPSSMRALKEAAKDSNPRLSSFAHTQHKRPPRTPASPRPEIQYLVTNLFSNKALGTHLDLTFLKTSSTYAEGCKRGKTPALHIKTHSGINMCLKIHFTQLKTQPNLLRWKRKPLQLQSAASLASSLFTKHKPSLLRII